MSEELNVRNDIIYIDGETFWPSITVNKLSKLIWTHLCTKAFFIFGVTKFYKIAMQQCHYYCTNYEYAYRYKVRGKIFTKVCDKSNKYQHEEVKTKCIEGDKNPVPNTTSFWGSIQCKLNKRFFFHDCNPLIEHLNYLQQQLYQSSLLGTTPGYRK